MNDRYDTFSQRFFAGIIDAIILTPLGFIEKIVENFADITAIIAGLTIVHGITFSYSIIMHWQTGQTLGKIIMKVKVLHVSESRLLSLRESFMRDSVYVLIETISLFILFAQTILKGEYTDYEGWVAGILGSIGFVWFLVEIITMFGNDKKRAFHDLMADSVVVNENITSTR
ncbi:MAG: RDD family protein [Cytophagales bacterium]